jgi:hypothetical protein
MHGKLRTPVLIEEHLGIGIETPPLHAAELVA